MDESDPVTEAQGITEEQAVSQLLDKWAKPEKEDPKDETKAEESAEDTETQQANADAEDEESTEESDAEDEGDIEIDVAGEKFKVPQGFAETAKRLEAKAKEVEAGATRKFQEAADLRKATETQAQAVKQLQRIAEANADLLADHRMVAKRLQTLETIDTSQTDTDTLTRLNAEYNQLRAAKDRIEAQYGQNVQTMKAEDAKALSAKREHAEKQLATRIKGWGTEKAKSLSEYAMARGAPAEALQNITEAWMVEILDDAAYGHQMRQSKPQLVKRVQEAPKTLKPGAAGTSKHAVSAKANELAAKAKRTGSVDDAVMALLARSSARKR